MCVCLIIKFFFPFGFTNIGSLSLIIDQIQNDSIQIEWKSSSSSSSFSNQLKLNRNPIINEIHITRYVPQPLKFQFEKIDVSHVYLFF